MHGSPQRVLERCNSDGAHFSFMWGYKTMYFNSHKHYQNPLMWYSSTTLISFTGENPANSILHTFSLESVTIVMTIIIISTFIKFRDERGATPLLGVDYLEYCSMVEAS